MNLVNFSESNVPVTTSLIVAEVFEKNHKDVIRAIEELFEQEALLRNDEKADSVEPNLTGTDLAERKIAPGSENPNEKADSVEPNLTGTPALGSWVKL